ncbi:MAG: hypothetical protein JNJ69_11600 [Leptospiraceae bacterium]|nr:hypothetical protein [Leptospiraceae bacterium]
MSLTALRNFFILATGYITLLLLFPQKLQTIESYAYAMGIERYYDLSQTFVQGQTAIALPDFARYHPNHPAVHWIAGKLFDCCALPGFTALRLFNIFGALLTLWFVYQSALLLWRRQGIAFAVASITAFSYVFWAAALSAEVHLSSVWLLSAAMFFLLRYLLAEGQNTNRTVSIAAMLFVGAMAFHLYAVFAAIPAGVALLFTGGKRYRAFALAATIVITGFFLFYVVFLAIELRIESPRRYFDTMLMYTRLTHVRYHGAEWFGMWFKTALQSLVYGFSPLSVAIKTIVGSTIVFSAFLFQRSGLPRSVKILLLGWPSVYILLNIIFGGRADGINGWLFSLPVLAILSGALFVRLEGKSEWRVYLALFPLLIVVANFFSAILPASKPENKEIIFLEAFKADGIAGSSAVQPVLLPVVFAVADPVLTYAEMWQIGSQLGYRQQKLVLFCCGSERPEEQLLQVLRENKGSMLLISDALDTKMEGLLKRSGRNANMLREQSGEISQVWMPSSIYFSRPADYRVLKRIRLWYVM